MRKGNDSLLIGIEQPPRSKCRVTHRVAASWPIEGPVGDAVDNAVVEINDSVWKGGFAEKREKITIC